MLVFILFHARRVLKRLMSGKRDGIWKKRKYEHRRDIRVGNEKSALFCHVRDQQHVFDFDQAKIVFRSNDYLKRRIVESALISSTPNVNLSQGHFAFNKVIAGIIKARYCR